MLRNGWRCATCRGRSSEADRARAILLTLEGRRAGEVAAALGVHVSTVHNWRGYFAYGRVAGLRRKAAQGSPQYPPDGLAPPDQLRAIDVRVRELLRDRDRCLQEVLLPRLAEVLSPPNASGRFAAAV